MAILAIGLIMLLGAHMFTTFRGWRAAVIARLGAGNYRSLYAAVSLLGLVLIVYGYGRARAAGPVMVWLPPLWTHDVTALLMWGAFVALASVGAPPTRIRGWLKHPLLAAVKIWALAHLLANGDAASMLLFGAFLAWAVYDRIALKKRGDAGAPAVARFTRKDAVVLAIGTVAYGLMVALHPYLIGVPVILS
jgi:uncharacterized membrane protein